ncbi:hypothetical protein DH2020_026799 [Rehmannia glutinosa]|uniref:DUF1995 domain-containing protein n=1 Tax=Rehmannia glutinosa TaxID=99300 RepID=A0ABR0VVV9_REHGL
MLDLIDSHSGVHNSNISPALFPPTLSGEVIIIESLAHQLHQVTITHMNKMMTHHHMLHKTSMRMLIDIGILDRGQHLGHFTPDHIISVEACYCVEGEMASATYSNMATYMPSIPKLSSTSHFPSSVYPSNACGSNGISRLRLISSSRTHAKFEKFQGQDDLEEDDDPQQEPIQQFVEETEEDDSCLPSDLEGAVRQSGQASAEFVSSGGMRAIVELLIPQLQFLDDEGAQVELWELSKIFLDTLIEETGGQRVKAVFPDAGAAALLKYQWKDAAFGFSSLGDRKPVTSEDEIVVMVVPDYQMLEYVEKIASDLSDDPPRPLIMWNPRLVSEDVGVGINVRRLRRNFLRFGVCFAASLLAETIVVLVFVYSMKPLPSGAVFRCYPGLWKVFYDDKERPNRYLLAKELIRRPDIEELEIIFGGQDNSEKGPSLFDQAAGIFSSFNRFMKVISR